MKIHRSELCDLSQAQFRKFYSLNMRRRGSMRGHVADCRKKSNNDPCTVYWIEDEAGRVLSWAIVTWWVVGDNNKDVMFYTRVTHRRQGLASLLAAKIKKRHKTQKLISYGWDSRSNSFFSKVRI